MDKNSKIYVTGHSGLVGVALLNQLKADGYTNIITASHSDVDLLDAAQVNKYFADNKPEYVFHLAAKVGGILGNKTYPADFMYENLAINTNVLHAAHENKVIKLLNFGSICIYPVAAPIPVKEEYLLTGPLEYSNEGYAMVKIASLMLAKKYKEQYQDNFISVMPANIYGINDNFHPINSHVAPALIRKFVAAVDSGAEEVVLWGTGKPTRDFIFSEDLAEGLVFIMNNYDGLEHLNIGPGYETSIKELAELIAEITGFKGKLVHDTTKPDGTPRRYLDVQKLETLGWKSKVSLREGLTKTIAWYQENKNNVREK